MKVFMEYKTGRLAGLLVGFPVRFIASVVIGFCIVGSVLAEDKIGLSPSGQNPANWCRLGLMGEYAAIAEPAVISAGSAAPGIDDSGSQDAAGNEVVCPSADASCQIDLNLRPGLSVLALHEWREYTCVVAIEQYYMVWVPSERIVRQPVATETDDWLGLWTDHYNRLRITSSEGQWHVEGDAYWFGALLNAETGERVVHFGDVSAVGQPEGRQWLVSHGDNEYDCQVSMTLVGDYLLVDDNRHCGGMNVSFQGLYAKPTPSFDCALAATAIEKVICADPELAQLDQQVANAYRYRLSNDDDPNMVRMSQRAWIKQRNRECRSGDKTCLENTYWRRLQKL